MRGDLSYNQKNKRPKSALFKNARKSFQKYFIPHEGNNHHPHILRQAAFSGFAFLIMLVFAFSTFQVLIFKKTNLTAFIFPEVLTQMLNQDRSQNNLNTLTVNQTLVRVAQAKANDMAKYGYFAHVSPEGKEPWYWFDQEGYSYKYAGENLAVDFTDSIDVNQAWLNSPTHRANLLNTKFTEVGVAMAKGIYNGRETIFIAQEFGAPKNVDITTAAPVAESATTQPTEPVQDAAYIPQPQKTVVATAPNQNSVNSSGNKINPAVKGVEVNNQVVTNKTNTKPVVYTENKTATSSQIEESGIITKAERIATNPKRMMALAYSLIGGLILFALILLFGVERHRHHHSMYVYGLMLLLLMFSLLIFFQSFIATSGSIAG